MTIDEFIAEYEKDQKLSFFFTRPRLVANAKFENSTGSEGSK